MTPLPDRLRDLTDDYLDGRLALSSQGEAGLAELEALLRADGSPGAQAREFFLRYAGHHTDLALEARARRAGARALARLQPPTPARHRGWRSAARWAVAAAVLLLAAGTGWGLAVGWAVPRGVAWLVNAQDCQWADGAPVFDLSPDLQPGTVLDVSQGLAEIRFACGARVVLEGPARLELLSHRSCRLHRGRVAVTVPDGLTGFEVHSPTGRVIDRGTAFGVVVRDDGATDVSVFQGQVDAQASGSALLQLEADQGARIDAAGVRERPLAESGPFVRAIVPPPVIVPRTLALDFRKPAGGLLDARGLGVGLSLRLPGTGGNLPAHDPNLRLDPGRGLLEVTTTESDINHQFKLPTGEYPGVRLADLGFTGAEDFAVTALLPNIPDLAFVGQFGLFAGTRSDRNIRGGLISRRQPRGYTQFLVNNDGGRDTDSNFVGLHTPGDSIRLTLARKGGRYAYTAENLTTGSASTLSIRHPVFLDGLGDLLVGFFAANPRSDERRAISLEEFRATVWTRESR